MTLPVDVGLVLRDGGCALLADVVRNAADVSWRQSHSRLTLVWAERPTPPEVASPAGRFAPPDDLQQVQRDAPGRQR
jgi:hypothetical protein